MQLIIPAFVSTAGFEPAKIILLTKNSNIRLYDLFNLTKIYSVDRLDKLSKIINLLIFS